MSIRSKVFKSCRELAKIEFDNKQLYRGSLYNSIKRFSSWNASFIPSVLEEKIESFQQRSKEDNNCIIKS